jgi:hypothetical protein
MQSEIAGHPQFKSPYVLWNRFCARYVNWVPCDNPPCCDKPEPPPPPPPSPPLPPALPPIAPAVCAALACACLVALRKCVEVTREVDLICHCRASCCITKACGRFVSWLTMDILIDQFITRRDPWDSMADRVGRRCARCASCEKCCENYRGDFPVPSPERDKMKPPWILPDRGC